MGNSGLVCIGQIKEKIYRYTKNNLIVISIKYRDKYYELN